MAGNSQLNLISLATSIRQPISFLYEDSRGLRLYQRTTSFKRSIVLLILAAIGANKALS